jgi:hypothetical protein
MKRITQVGSYFLCKKALKNVKSLNPKKTKTVVCKSEMADFMLLMKLGGKQFITLEIFNLRRFILR